MRRAGRGIWVSQPRGPCKYRSPFCRERHRIESALARPAPGFGVKLISRFACPELREI